MATPKGDAERQLVRDLVESGITDWPTIAKRLGISTTQLRGRLSYWRTKHPAPWLDQIPRSFVQPKPSPIPTASDLDALADLLAKEKSDNQICKQLGITQHRLIQWRSYARANGIPLPRRGVKPWKPSKRDRTMRDRYERDGWTYSEIAEEVGLSRERVRQVLAKMGVATRKSGPATITPEEEEAIRSMLPDHTYQEIADHLDLPHATVASWSVTHIPKRQRQKRNKTPLPPWTKDFIRDYQAGDEVQTLADRYGFETRRKAYGFLRHLRQRGILKTSYEDILASGRRPSRRSRMSAAIQEHIRDLYHEGLTYAKIAEAVEKPRGTVSNWILSEITRGALQRRPRIQYPDPLDQFIKDYEAGASAQELMDAYNLPSRERVWHIGSRLRKQGLMQEAANDRKPPITRTASRKLTRLYNAGHTYREMAEAIGDSPARIYTWVRRNQASGDLQPRQHPSTILPRFTDRFIADYEKGATSADLCRRYMFESEEKVRIFVSRLRKTGKLTTYQRPRYTVTKAQAPRIRAMYQRGDSFRKMAEATGLGSAFLTKWCQKEIAEGRLEDRRRQGSW